MLLVTNQERVEPRFSAGPRTPGPVLPEPPRPPALGGHESHSARCRPDGPRAELCPGRAWPSIAQPVGPCGERRCPASTTGFGSHVSDRSAGQCRAGSGPASQSRAGDAERPGEEAQGSGTQAARCAPPPAGPGQAGRAGARGYGARGSGPAGRADSLRTPAPPLLASPAELGAPGRIKDRFVLTLQ